MGRPKHLVIPDEHSHPDYDNDRFDAIGEFILQEKPDVIIRLGDLGDFSSLSSYDRGKLSAERERVQRDLECVQDAERRLMRPINEYNERRARNKERLYRPRKIKLKGNHDDRLDRYVQDNPILAGILGTELLDTDGWESVGFKCSVEVDGIGYSHYFTSGVAGRPISGESIGKSLCNKLHRSSVQGHSHTFDHSERSDRTGQKLFGLSAGCVSHPAYVADWCRDTVHMWWRGIVILEDVDGEGYYDALRAITLRKIMRDRSIPQDGPEEFAKRGDDFID